MRILAMVLGALLLMGPGGASLLAHDRVAPVLGNSGHRNVPRLLNPANDVRATVKSEAAPSNEAARTWNEAKATLTPRVEPSAPCGSVTVTELPAARAALPLTRAEECALRPKDVFKECDKCPEMVVLPAGRFTMGSPASDKDRRDHEGPQHVVTIAQPFAVGRFQVTVEQFAAFVAETGHDVGSKCWTFEAGKAEERQDRSWHNPGFAQADTHPAVCLSWIDAEAYVGWISRKTGKTYRQLSEAEWEYAARARTEPGVYLRYWFGDEEKDLCRHGNGADQEARSRISGTSGWTIAPCNDGHAYTAPAGSFPANGFGLHDMAGNAWQWTADCWNESYNGAPSDGSAWIAGDCSRRVLRGGSWINNPKVLRAANRDRNMPGLRYSFNGLRLARTLAP